MWRAWGCRADFAKAINLGKQRVHVPPDGSIPKELQCAITKDVADNAHVLPCCQHNVSLAAITPILEERATCPICLQSDISVDMLKPNLRLREMVRMFLKTALERGISLKRPTRPDGDSKANATIPQAQRAVALDPALAEGPAKAEVQTDVGKTFSESDSDTVQGSSGKHAERGNSPSTEVQRASRSPSRGQNEGGIDSRDERDSRNNREVFDVDRNGTREGNRRTKKAGAKRRR